MNIQTSVYEQLGRYIREKRAGAQISQVKLSEQTDVSQRAISALENGGKISDDNASALLEYFGAKMIISAVIEQASDESGEKTEQ